MARPPNRKAACREAQQLLYRRLPGARRTTVRAHLQRAWFIASNIYQRWHVGPHQWQAKHLRWYLANIAMHFKPSTQYRHWLTVRALLTALDRDHDWAQLLNGPWIRPNGSDAPLKAGRPWKKPN